eukprot:gene5015-34800_t
MGDGGWRETFRVSTARSFSPIEVLSCNRQIAGTGRRAILVEVEDCRCQPRSWSSATPSLPRSRLQSRPTRGPPDADARTVVSAQLPMVSAAATHTDTVLGTYLGQGPPRRGRGRFVIRRPTINRGDPRRPRAYGTRVRAVPFVYITPCRSRLYRSFSSFSPIAPTAKPDKIKIKLTRMALQLAGTGRPLRGVVAKASKSPEVFRPAVPSALHVVLRGIQASTLTAATGVVMAVLATDLVFSSPAYAQDLGATLFNNNCAACHQGGNNSVINDRTLDKAALEAYLEGGYSLDAVTHQINNGKGPMPAWEDTLEEEEIAALAQYVMSQSTVSGWGNNP